MINETVVEIAVKTVPMIQETFHRPEINKSIDIQHLVKTLEQLRIVCLQSLDHGFQFGPVGVIGIVLFFESSNPTRPEITYLRFVKIPFLAPKLPLEKGVIDAFKIGIHTL